MKLYQAIKIQGYGNKEVVVDCRHAKFWFYQELKRLSGDHSIDGSTRHDNGTLEYKADWSTCNTIRRALDKIATRQRDMRFPESEFMQSIGNSCARSKGTIAANELFETIQFFNGIGKLFPATEGELRSIAIVFVEANTVSEALNKVEEVENAAADESNESELPI